MTDCLRSIGAASGRGDDGGSAGTGGGGSLERGDRRVRSRSAPLDVRFFANLPRPPRNDIRLGNAAVRAGLASADDGALEGASDTLPRRICGRGNGGSGCRLSVAVSNVPIVPSVVMLSLVGIRGECCGGCASLSAGARSVASGVDGARDSDVVGEAVSVREGVGEGARASDSS